MAPAASGRGTRLTPGPATSDERDSRDGADRRRSPLRVGLLYLLFGAAWILFTDNLLPGIVQDPGQWQTYKGLAFVVASAGLIYVLVQRELAARRRAERRRRAADKRYRVMFEQSVAGFFRSAMDGEILECNRALARMLGYDEVDGLVGTNARDYYVQTGDRETWIGELEETGEVRNRELQLRRHDGGSVWTLMNAVLQRDESGRPVLAGTMVDVTDRKRLRDELEAYAYHDTVTGLPNRRHLKDAAEDVLSKAERDGRTVGLLYLDLERFKRINETLGHEVGDEILLQFGQRMRRELREEDMAARIGGDEFAVLLNTVDDVEGARRAGQRLHDVLSEPFFAGDRSLSISSSIGVAVYPDHAGSFADLLSHADQAMYQAFEKKGGVHVFQPPSISARRDQIAEEEDLRTALREGQFELYFQPVYRIEDHRMIGAEALARWRHPDLGLRSPAVFIPVAEHTGLIRDLDLWAFRTVIERAPDLVADGPLEWLSVNVSAQSLRHDDVLDRFFGYLEDSGLGEGGIVVEITESTAMQAPRAGVQVFRGLQRRGARVAIDDFGTGHSALAYLKTLPSDIVKLDMIFTRGIEASRREDRLLKALIELGRTLEVEVAAEGVETAGQYHRLASHGCHLAQGYHLGRPTPVNELRQILEDERQPRGPGADDADPRDRGDGERG